MGSQILLLQSGYIFLSTRVGSGYGSICMTRFQLCNKKLISQ